MRAAEAAGRRVGGLAGGLGEDDLVGKGRHGRGQRLHSSGNVMSISWRYSPHPPSDNYSNLFL